jgi:hypothetical protein
VTETWREIAASDVQPGDRVRARGEELTVTRIETGFFGNPAMLAFIEDTPERWYKRPVPADTPVEVLQRG